jgi:hypothetical protein
LSVDVAGGEDYAQTKRHYQLNDYAAVPFNATQDYYPVGARAFLSNRTVFDVTKGWVLHDHKQPAAPLFFGFLPWPSPAPSFEGKRFMFRPTQRCLVRFGNINSVQHEIPANQTTIFWQRTWVVFVQAAATAGTLRMSIEG